MRSPIQYGKRLLLTELDRQAKEIPDRVLFSVPMGNTLKDGFKNITISTLANAVNRAAWFFESILGKSETFETVGYLGPTDLRYQIFAYALCKIGRKILFISPRNSIEGDLNVIDKSYCSMWLLPSQHQKYPNLSKIFSARKNMNVIRVPEVDELLDSTPVQHYPYDKTFEQARKDPFMVLHSSGSTGLPKPILVPQGTMATADAHNLIETTENGFRLQSYYWSSAKSYIAFPLFHAAGIFYTTSHSIFHKCVFALGGDIPITPTLVEYMIDHEKVDGIMVAPSIIDEVVNTPSSYEKLRNVKFVVTGGGPLSKATGTKIIAVTTLDNALGTTEGLLPPTYRVPPEDFHYMNYHDCNGFEYRDKGNGLYEQVQIRDPKYELFQGYMQTFPDVNEFSTKDLYAKHPTKEGLWLYRGRADDVIVLSNGEKVNPLDIESKINDHPAVRSALVVGQAHFQTALLIELADTAPLTKEKQELLSKSLWPTIMEANGPAPAHARIQEGFLIFSDPLKPFLRAGKGTVQRAATVHLYQKEIEEFYGKMDTAEYKGDLDVTSLEGLRSGLQDICSNLTKTKRAVQIEDDLFAAGFDSLSVITLVRQLKSILKAHGLDGEKLQPAMIYGNPTVSALTDLVYKMIHKSDIDAPEDANKKLMHELFLKYTTDLPTSTSSKTTPPMDEVSVILTGSTGSLGSYILESLLRNPAIKSVYCFNRSADAKDRQTALSKSNGFNTDFASLPNVKFLHTNLAEQNFGLLDSEYSELQNTATHIIHNQWQVNFNLSLSSFIPHIQGVRNLIDFSASSEFNAEIFFISSVGVVQGKKWDGPVPEEVIMDYGSASLGYGASKLVSEMVLNEACRRGGVRATVCRAGQIAGPVEREEGVWNRWEWLPTIISTSRYLNYLPNTLASMSRIDWIPVDHLATVILELSLSSPTLPNNTTKIYHTVNPTATTWTSLLPTILAHLGPGMKTVTWEEWVKMLQRSAAEEKGEKNPGIKLLGFFERVSDGSGEGAVLDTRKTREVSRGMRGLGGVGEEWMGRWLRQWDRGVS